MYRLTSINLIELSEACYINNDRLKTRTGNLGEHSELFVRIIRAEKDDLLAGTYSTITLCILLCIAMYYV